ncbi:MAG: hypothetical protein ABII72_00455 [Parcubacteria group bacterium]
MMINSGEKLTINQEAVDELDYLEFREEKEQELMAQRYEMALAARRLHKYLSQPRKEDFHYEEFSANVDLKELSEDVRGEFKNVIKDYHRLAENQLQKEEDLLEEVYFINNSFRNCGGSEPFVDSPDKQVVKDTIKNDPSLLGRIVFELTIHSKPIKPVSFRRRGGFFIMTFTDRADYLVFKHRRSDIPATESSVGCFSIRQVDVQGVRLDNVIVAEEQNTLEETQGIIDHEVQHFKNWRIFGKGSGETLFKHEPRIPSSNEQKVVINSAHKAVKDELLAKLYDERRNIGHISELKDEYKYLYEYLDNPQAVDDVIDQITDSLNDLGDLYEDNEIRKVIADMLLDIPFVKIPKYIKAIGRYFEKRIETLSQTGFNEEIRQATFKLTGALHLETNE